MNNVIPKTIGLLALQGDYDMHRKAVESLGYNVAEVRTGAELESVDCLIIPGGETTTMRKLMVADGLFEPLREFAQTHPLMGTCAGLVLLGHRTTGRDNQETLGLIDCETARNAYGRQFHSFRETGTLELTGRQQPFEMVFIRAPKITDVGEGVEILGRLGDEPTLIRQGNILAMTFHPELSGDTAIHEYFLSMIPSDLSG